MELARVRRAQWAAAVARERFIITGVSFVALLVLRAISANSQFAELAHRDSDRRGRRGALRRFHAAVHGPLPQPDPDLRERHQPQRPAHVKKETGIP
jgi:hypothetical protein